MEVLDGSPIVLVTINARYIHASLGLRYLYANMGPLQSRTRICEYTLDARPEDVVEELLEMEPAIIAFGVYIWNVRETESVVKQLKVIVPDTPIIVGGPEVSFEHDKQALTGAADFVVNGPGDLAFPELCRQLINGYAPPSRVVEGEQPCLDDIALPYRFFNEEDIRHRVIYVEASRGCPFRCEFCLSSLDKTAWPFDTSRFLFELEVLYQRGTRHFKFVDRTFNLRTDTCVRILEFFLERMDDKLFVHFELIPDRLPSALKDTISRFPPGSLQFEVGIQSFNTDVQTLVSRKQDTRKSCDNLLWLRRNSQAHIHADLIFGLPGEDLDSFAEGFNHLYTLGPHEIQVGILKRLRGSPIIRHTREFSLKFNPEPPYNILSTDRISFQEMQRVVRFARYWDLIANSGRFIKTLPLLLGSEPFENFMQVSNAIFQASGKTHGISLLRLFELVDAVSTVFEGVDGALVRETLGADFHRTGLKSYPAFLQERRQEGQASRASNSIARKNRRQQRHLVD